MNVLTSESKTLLSDISRKLLLMSSVPMFCKSSAGLFEPIKRAFEADYTKYSSISITPALISKTGVVLKSPDTFSFSDIPSSIVTLMHNELTKEVRYVFKFGESRNIILIFYLSRDDDIITSELIKNVYIWFAMLNAKADNIGCTPPHKLICWFYLTSAKKTIESGEVLSAVNANTAFTRTCVRPDNLNEIVIYRKEEWFKVLIHETIHTYGLDFSDYSDELLSKCASQIRKSLGLSAQSTAVNVYEAYTELWAEITNILFIWCNIPTDIRAHLNIDAMLILETAFGVGQMQKVLGFMGLDIGDIIHGTGGDKYSEKTNILAYYILKNIAMCNMDIFLKDIVNKSSGNYLEYVNFGSNKAKCASFCDFVTDLENIRKCDSGDIISVGGNTMRMTAWEIQ